MGWEAVRRPMPGRWVLEAECRDVDPELFFPSRGDHGDAAKKVCATCLVKVDCLEYGMKEKTGVWGGMTERERARERRRRAIQRKRESA